MKLFMLSKILLINQLILFIILPTDANHKFVNKNKYENKLFLNLTSAAHALILKQINNNLELRMLQNNPQAGVKQQANMNGAYSFDLKVNVDFNTGHVQLKTPPSLPFVRKPQIPISNAMFYTPPPVYYAQTMLSNQPIFQMQSQSPYSSNCKVSQSTGAAQLSGSQNSTYQLQQTVEAVQCVICQKLIRSEDFNNHLVEHRNRKKQFPNINRVEKVFPTHPQISLRGRNSLGGAEVKETHTYNFNETSRRNDQTSRISQVTFQPPQHHAMPQTSRQLSSRMISHPQSEFYLSHSSFNDQSSLQTLNPVNSNTSQVSMRNNGLALQMQSDPRSNINYPMHANSQINALMREDKNMNGFDFHKIESVIIRPDDNRREGFQQCGQSQISCNSTPSRQSSIYQIQKELDRRYENGVSDINSDDEDEDYQPYSKSYHSVGWKQRINKADNLHGSQMTEKLSKSKMPLNYLAREEFIESTTHNSCNRKSNEQK